MKGNRVVSSFVLGTIALSSHRAEATNESGVEVGLRAGYGIPLGQALDGMALDNAYSNQIPLWLDAGYRFTPKIVAGLYAEYGFLSIADGTCGASADCSGHDIHLGIEGQYRFLPSAQFDPWVGLGLGYEWATTSLKAGGADLTYTLRGFEFLNLQGGTDFKVTDQLGVGPFVSLALGQFTNVGGPGSGGISGSNTGDIERKALHEWLVLGVRGTFGV
jgi:outer membrane protein W